MKRFTIKQEPGKTLLESLISNQIFVDNPCNGKGVCGKCKVQIIKGDVGELSESEKGFLSQEEMDAGIRLACMVSPKTDVEIQLVKNEKKHEVLTDGFLPEFEKDPDIVKRIIKIKRPSLEDQTALEDQIVNQLEIESVPYHLLKKLRLVEGIYTAVLKRDAQGLNLMEIESGDTRNLLYGVAIDIGTTTVVAALVDMLTGEELANASMINAQKQYGLDVLTRITYEIEHPENGRMELQRTMVDSLNALITELCEKTGVIKEQIYEITVGANCTMMHMLLGLDATTIGKAPYAPLFVSAKEIEAKEIGIVAAEHSRLYCIPSVSSYIGADIVAGAYVCGLHKTDQNILFIDIGTNGEIVYSRKGDMLCCSCAAGPALEGMNISSGMRACDGAIEDVRISEEGIEVKVIGESEPEGICGSGILATVKELLRTGIIKKEGTFLKLNQLKECDFRKNMLQLNGKKREFILQNSPKKMLVTQQDIRQVQLAKGAILSGFYALLQKEGKRMEDLDQVMIAGQFGAHLPSESLIGVGILPKEVKEKLIYVGNSSKTGAYMALMSGKVKKEMENIAKNMEYMELGTVKGYERLFAECLIFPEN